MQIIQRKIQDINPAKYNPRKITDSELSGLKESLKKFGFVEPLIVNKRTNTLVGGHARLRAAESLGFKEVPVLDVDLSLSEEKALNVALNSQTISGKFDEDILRSLLVEIQFETPDLFSDLNMEIMIPNLFEPEKFDMEDDLKDDMNKKYILEVTFPNDMELADIRDDLISRGYIVKEK